MTGSGDARVTATTTGWRTESRYYRRSPGLGWLLGLLLIPLLFGWLSAGALKPKVNVTAPSINATAPSVSVPGLDFSPLSLLRNGKDWTLSGILPDLASKTSLMDKLKGLLGGGVNLIDKIDIAAGATAPEFAGFDGLLKAAGDIGDFRFTIDRDTLTLTGTAPTQEIKDAVGAAAKAGWPNVQVINNIAVKGAAVDCNDLQSTINAALAVPIKFATGSDALSADAQASLAPVATAVKACKDVKLTVIGHTDNTGDDAVNVPLSEGRAKSVAAYLVSQGLSADAITSKGVGSADPVESNDTEAGKAENRRTEIKVD